MQRIRFRNGRRPVRQIGLLTMLASVLYSAYAQIPSGARYHEYPSDPYVPVERSDQQTSPAYTIYSKSFRAVQVNVDSAGRNIIGDAANEPSIAVDPNNPARIAIGWRQFNTIASNFRQAGIGFTTNGGRTWRFPGVIEPGIFRSDPVLDSDDQGRFYYNSLTSDGSGFHCKVFRSSTGGATWDSGTFAQGGDKQWMVIDKTASQGNGHIYATWTAGVSICDTGSFTRSVNSGASYQACTVVPHEPFWGSLAVGPEGELYICGADITGFAVVRSTTARDSANHVSWGAASLVNLDGEVSVFNGTQSPNPAGLLGQAWVAVDNSTRPSRGNVYLLCSVNRNSVSDPLDVMFARSTDGGATWSNPIRVNDDTTTSSWQWFGTMSVAPNGRIDVIWLDTRDNPGSLNSSLYYAFSTNAGTTWSRNERLSEAFNPHVGWPQQNKMGDYFHMVSDDTGAHLAWAATFNGEQDVYYGRISSLTSTGISTREGQVPMTFSLKQNYPNPFNPGTTISFEVQTAGRVSVAVFDLLGRKIATLADEEFMPGKHSVSWDATDAASGVYFYRMHAAGWTGTRRLVVLK